MDILPFCVDCKKDMNVMTNEVYVIQHSKRGPWKIHVGDRYQCPVCGKQIVADAGVPPIDNFGDNEEFARTLENARKREHYELAAS